MIKQIVRLLVCAVVLLSMPYTIYFHVVRISSRWRCRKQHYCRPVNTCHEYRCKFACCCRDYEYLLSDEEAEKLEELIAELKKSN